MSKENTGTNDESQVSGKFTMIPNEILGMLGKNVRTPAGTVEKIDGDDLAWWGFFFTFRYQKMQCYQNRNTISDRFDCDVKTVTRRTARLERLGLLTIEQRKGRSSIYTAASVEKFLAMKTREKVTPKSEEKQGNGNGHEEAAIPQAEQAKLAAATATPSTDAPANQPAGQNPGVVLEPAPVVAGQRDSVASNDDGSGDAGTDDDHKVKHTVADTTAGRPIVVTGYRTPTLQSKGTIYTPEEMARFAAEERTKYANGGTPF